MDFISTSQAIPDKIEIIGTNSNLFRQQSFSRDQIEKKPGSEAENENEIILMDELCSEEESEHSSEIIERILELENAEE